MSSECIEIKTLHDDTALITVDDLYLYVTLDFLFTRVLLQDLIFEDKYKAISSGGGGFRLALGSANYHTVKQLIIKNDEINE